jgi:hypothetical protein
MAFKKIIISCVSDANKINNRGFIDSGKYHRFLEVVKNQTEGIEA